jgi:hypothetical protein
MTTANTSMAAKELADERAWNRVTLLMIVVVLTIVSFTVVGWA